jgi:hypothetical protein
VTITTRSVSANEPCRCWSGSPAKLPASWRRWSAPAAVGADRGVGRDRSGESTDRALDLGSLGGAVVADRLKDPKTLAGVVLCVLALVFPLGRRRR